MQMQFLYNRAKIILFTISILAEASENSFIKSKNQPFYISPVAEFNIRGKTILVKRDDLLKLEQSGISGNKARKMYDLNEKPAVDIPDLIVSHGGIQSNAMLALASVAHSKGKRFHYYTKSPGKWHREHGGISNLTRAIELGMELKGLQPDYYMNIFGGDNGPEHPPIHLCSTKDLWVPQGGAYPGAEAGLKLLADEIALYWAKQSCNLRYLNSELMVFVPAGTGTTAAFLSRHLLSHGIKVTALPCVGDGKYLKRQMLRVLSGCNADLPHIIEGCEKFPFGKPRSKLLEIWKELKNSGLDVDLVYAVRAWEIIFESWDSLDQHTVCMYYHSGGLEGVESQLSRYK